MKKPSIQSEMTFIVLITSALLNSVSFIFFNSSLSKETFSRMNGSVQFLSYKFSFSEEKCFKQMAVIVILNYEKKKCQCWNIFNKINCLNLAYVSCAFLQILIIENTVKANTLVRHFKAELFL